MSLITKSLFLFKELQLNFNCYNKFRFILVSFFIFCKIFLELIMMLIFIPTIGYILSSYKNIDNNSLYMYMNFTDKIDFILFLLFGLLMLLFAKLLGEIILNKLIRGAIRKWVIIIEQTVLSNVIKSNYLSYINIASSRNSGGISLILKIPHNSSILILALLQLFARLANILVLLVLILFLFPFIIVIYAVLVFCIGYIFVNWPKKQTAKLMEKKADKILQLGYKTEIILQNFLQVKLLLSQIIINFIKPFRLQILDLEIKILQSREYAAIRIEFFFIAIAIFVFIALLSYTRDMQLVVPYVTSLLFISFRVMLLLTTATQNRDELIAVYEKLARGLSFYKKLKEEKLGSKLIVFNKKLVLDHLSFSYQSDDIIKDISLTINKKECVGFIGKSGSGKTTIMNILCGVLYNYRGSYIIDDQIVDHDSLLSLRSKIAYIDQNNQLFADNYIDNIIGFDDKKDKDIDYDAVKQCLINVNLWDFVKNSSHGLKTYIGSQGNLLSGGQKQRLAIARALYNKPEILLLDEATSNLDVETEYNIVSLIPVLKQSTTVILVAHRLSALKYCDNLFFIEHGRIKYSGSWESLYKQSEEFRDYIEKYNINN